MTDYLQIRRQVIEIYIAGDKIIINSKITVKVIDYLGGDRFRLYQSTGLINEEIALTGKPDPGNIVLAGKVLRGVAAAGRQQQKE